MRDIPWLLVVAVVVVFALSLLLFGELLSGCRA